ncbi:MAG: hypothetical protein ACFFD1_16480 [Candidatus Thorarchaeota archaeon]
MNLKYTPCTYHPNNAAVTICERCRRPICLEDKRIYRRAHTRGTGESSYTYYTQHDYCVLCNASQLSHDAKWSPLTLVCLIPFLLIFFLAFIPLYGTFNQSGTFFSLFPTFFIGILVFILIIMMGSILSKRNKAKEAELEAIRFRHSLDQRTSPMDYKRYNSTESKKFSSEPSYDSSQFSIDRSEPFTMVCFECGNRLSLQDKFCSNCGDSTKEELEKYYQFEKNNKNNY